MTAIYSHPDDFKDEIKAIAMQHTLVISELQALSELAFDNAIDSKNDKATRTIHADYYRRLNKLLKVCE